MSDQYARQLLEKRARDKLLQQKPQDLLKNPILTAQSQQDIVISVGPIQIPVNLSQSLRQSSPQILRQLRQQIDRILESSSRQ